MKMSKVASSEKLFHDKEGRCVSLKDVIEEIKQYIEKQPNSFYEIVIGSDSQATQYGKTPFVAAIVIRRIGNGGKYFWMKKEDITYNLKDRIWKEALLSITLAQEFRSLLRESVGEELFWEGKFNFQCIHLDIGEDGPTKELIDGISGMVKGYGFIPVIKPYSYGAFVVADKHT